MELIIEFLLELIFEGMIEGSTNKKVPLPIRILLGTIVSCTFLGVTIGLIILGIILTKENTWGGLFITIVGIILLIGLGSKAYTHIKERK